MINAASEPSPIFVSFSVEKYSFISKYESLDGGVNFDLTLESTSPNYFGVFTRGRGKKGQCIRATLFSKLRDIKRNGIQTNVYWVVDDVGASLSYNNINYGPRLTWLPRTSRSVCGI